MAIHQVKVRDVTFEYDEDQVYAWDAEGGHWEFWFYHRQAQPTEASIKALIEQEWPADE